MTRRKSFTRPFAFDLRRRVSCSLSSGGKISAPKSSASEHRRISTFVAFLKRARLSQLDGLVHGPNLPSQKPAISSLSQQGTVDNGALPPEIDAGPLSNCLEVLLGQDDAGLTSSSLNFPSQSDLLAGEDPGFGILLALTITMHRILMSPLNGVGLGSRTLPPESRST